MASAQDVRNVARAGKQAVEAAKDLGSALKFGKALMDGSKSKISNVSAFLMLALALLLDATQILISFADAGVIGGPLILAIQLPVFWFWFKMCGANYFSARATASKVITGILELVPVLNDFIPSTTIDVIAAIGFVRIEEAGLAGSGSGGGEEGSTETGGGQNVRTARRNNPSQSTDRASVKPAGVVNLKRA